MSLTSDELTRVVAELQPFAGGTLQKIRAVSPRAVVLELRVPGATHELLISAEAEGCRFHRATERPRREEEGPPLHVQSLLRAHLLPARLASLAQVPGERIVRLELDTPRGRRTLVAELTGRGGNLHLLGEDDLLVGSAVPPPPERGLAAGAPWHPPASPPGPGRGGDRFREATGGEEFPLSRAIEERYGPAVAARALERTRRETARSLAAARTRLARTLDKLAQDEARAAAAGELRARADLLKTALGRVPRGAASVTLTDWSSGEARDVEVPLSPALSPKENLDRLYHQYRRLSAARDRIAARRADLEARLGRLDALALEVNRVGSDAELRELAAAAARSAPAGRGRADFAGAAAGAASGAAGGGAAPRAKGNRAGRGRAAPERARPPYRAYLSASGRPIWVGRGARQNDELTFKVAGGNDLWAHARGVTGAHVVVPLRGGADPDEETLLDACALAVHHSGSRGEAVADVACTRARHVRRPKGGAPGGVLYTQEKVVAYRHDEVRLARLLAQAPEF